MKTETLILKSNPNVTLTTYLLDTSPELPNASVRPAVLILPGGGYRACSDREAEPVAMAFLAQGYHAFVLRYSLNKNAAFPKPLRDAEEALETIRARAAEWGIVEDKIAVCGFSAGGHLAAALGTMGRVRPNALILGYPAIVETISDILPAPIPGVDTRVDTRTPPSFLFTTSDDSLVPARNTLAFAAALDKAGVPFERHVFQSGTHGLSLSKPHTSGGNKFMVNPAVARWIDLCVTWLESLFDGFVADREGPQMATTSDLNGYSIDVPLQVCWDNPECMAVVKEFFPTIEDNPNIKLAMGLSLRSINQYGKQVDDDAMERLDRKLKAISFPQ